MLKLIQILNESHAVLISETHYSSAFKTDKSAGALIVLITTSAGSITVTQQCGLTEDGTFYDPVSAAAAALGAITAAGFTVGTRYISISPIAAPWSRIKIIEAGSAATTVTLTIYQLIDTNWR
uniref:Uncharacterized protein n=1 Tax=viral metagenome TaxID=1070528 RepID=A0A6M3JCD6_9ZZZZ